MTSKSSRYLAPYLFNLISWLLTLPWFIFIGIFTIPGIFSALFTIPPGYGVVSPQVLDQTINVLLVVAIQVVPLLGITYAGWNLFKPSSIKSIETNILVSHALWIKSVLPLLGLIIAQWMYGQDFLTPLFAQPVQDLFYLASPVFAALALLLGKQVTGVASETPQ